MATQIDFGLRSQLEDRKGKLEEAIDSSPQDSHLNSLLREVDAALARMNDGSFGLCETCHETIERDRLSMDPLARFCLDHLTPPQQRALQQDLELAARIQEGLLPRHDMRYGGWQTEYHYEPAGPVSGDYCDLVTSEDGSLYFMLGDVSGKGVAASMLMAHLHAMFRALIGVGLPLAQIVERGSRLFCESTLASQFATLVCGKATSKGAIELCNAGHNPPLLVRGNEVRSIDATGLPLGIFSSEQFSVQSAQLNRGDFLVLYTDGLSEAQDSSGAEFGVQPLIELTRAHGSPAPGDLVRMLISKATEFRAGAPKSDDVAMLVIKRVE